MRRFVPVFGVVETVPEAGFEAPTVRRNVPVHAS